MGPPPFSVYSLFSGGMWKKPGVPVKNRERTEGERPGSGPNRQRWEAVFRRERRPASLDRTEEANAFSALFTGEKPRERETLRAFCAVFPRLKKEFYTMNQSNVKKLAVAGLLCALAVVGSMFIVFPVFGSKCAPVQHMVNILCAVFLGPWYGVGVAFGASLIRNLLGVGSLMAFPGSMCGALLCGLVFWKTKNLTATLVGEVFGTGIIGGLAAYPVAVLFMNVSAAAVAFYAYIIPFLISTVAGSVLAGILVAALKRTGALKTMGAALEQ